MVLERIVREVLLKTFRETVRQVLRKGGHDKSEAKKKLNEARKALRSRNFKEAFEDVSAARFYIMELEVDDKPVHTEHLVERIFDPLMDNLWELWQHDDELSEQRKDQLVRRSLELIDDMEEAIDNPKGKKAQPPTRVHTVRDARLWEIAKRTVKEQYGDRDDEKFWSIVSRVFTRMKIRAGGRPEEEVERAVQYLQEKHGKVIPIPKKGRRRKEIEEVMENKRRMMKRWKPEEDEWWTEDEIDWFESYHGILRSILKPDEDGIYESELVRRLVEMGEAENEREAVGMIYSFLEYLECREKEKREISGWW